MTASTERRGPVPRPRVPDLQFDADDVPEAWFDGDPARTASWNALSVIVCVAERTFVDIGSWLIEHIEDDDVAQQTTLFMQQEAIHSAMHGRMNKRLTARGLPTAAVDAFAQEAVERVRQVAGPSVFTATGLAGEQVIGELAHAILARPAAMEGLPPKLRALFLWHWYEEVEHQASLHEGWVAVHGDDNNTRHLRVVGSAYFLLFIAMVWPAATWAFSNPRQRRSARHWSGVLGQMFGDEGLLRGVASNLRNMARVGYHPSDNHDPFPTLAQHHDAWIDDRWEIPAKQAPRRRSGRPVVPTVGVGSWGSVARYGVWLAGRTVRFLVRSA